jgi:DNA helicase II / ATP-dependent DNA helicase PcrA
MMMTLQEDSISDKTDKSLSMFLQTISLMTDADEKEENPDTVTLMSVHSAKGS